MAMIDRAAFSRGVLDVMTLAPLRRLLADMCRKPTPNAEKE